MVYNNCALYMLYKQCRGFYCCSKIVVNARSVFRIQEHHLVSEMFLFLFRIFFYIHIHIHGVKKLVLGTQCTGDLDELQH